MSIPLRVDADLFASAKAVGAAQSRSASQQLAHWARVGRELEASRGVSHRAITDVLAGRSGYDALDEREQAVVRAEWDDATAARLASLDLAAEFVAADDTWSEADSDGRVVVFEPRDA